jgi:hypothetical protein
MMCGSSLELKLHIMKIQEEPYVKHKNVGETGCKSTCHEDVRETGSRIHTIKTYGELEVTFHGMKIQEEPNIKHYATKMGRGDQM